MAASTSRSFLRALRATPACAAPSRLAITRSMPRFYSTAPEQETPLLTKLKGSLKPAMRLKDAPRLTVLRSVMATTLEAAKAGRPLTTDGSVYALLVKMRGAAELSVADAQKAGREDLVEKASQEISVINEYLSQSGIEAVTEEELRAMVQKAWDSLDAAAKEKRSRILDLVRKEVYLLAEQSGKYMDKREVSNIATEFVNAKYPKA
jgi:uncharacterized protein YqeY